jgi:hypothetical protein
MSPEALLRAVAAGVVVEHPPRVAFERGGVRIYVATFPDAPGVATVSVYLDGGLRCVAVVALTSSGRARLVYGIDVDGGGWAHVAQLLSEAAREVLG